MNRLNKQTNKQTNNHINEPSIRSLKMPSKNNYFLFEKNKDLGFIIPYTLMTQRGSGAEKF